MSFRIVQAGNGPNRDVVLVWHVAQSLDSALRQNAPTDALIAVETLPAMQSAYAKSATLARDAVAAFEKKEGFKARNVYLVGWSEGCQGIRRSLLAGDKPAVAIACDGVHVNRPAQPWQVAPWTQLASEARAGERLFILTHSQVPGPSPTVRSTEESAPLVADTTGGNRTDSGPGAYRTIAGGLQVWGSPGSAASDHAAQQTRILPIALAEARSILGQGGGEPASRPFVAGSGSGDLPGPTVPLPGPGDVPPGQGQPPTPGRPENPPPIAKEDGPGGGAVFACFVFAVLGAAMLRRRRR